MFAIVLQTKKKRKKNFNWCAKTCFVGLGGIEIRYSGAHRGQLTDGDVGRLGPKQACQCEVAPVLAPPIAELGEIWIYYRRHLVVKGKPAYSVRRKCVNDQVGLVMSAQSNA